MADTDLQSITDDELLELYRNAASAVSYYNAAESPQYGRETEARNAAIARFRKIATEVQTRNLPTPKGGYLL